MTETIFVRPESLAWETKCSYRANQPCSPNTGRSYNRNVRGSGPGPQQTLERDGGICSCTKTAVAKNNLPCHGLIAAVIPCSEQGAIRFALRQKLVAFMLQNEGGANTSARAAIMSLLQCASSQHELSTEAGLALPNSDTVSPRITG